MPKLDLPETSATAEAIYAAYVAKREDARGYLGASVIGHECERKLWYDFRWAGEEQFDGRMLRMFETGDMEEWRIVQNLRDAGMEVWDKDEAGNQFGFLDIGGHFSGHCDGIVLGVPEAKKSPHLLECKTSSDKLFGELKLEGVRKSKPMHYAQMQIYMGYLVLDRALYVVVNKNTDEIYTERIEFSRKEYRGLIDKAERIILATEPAERIGKRDDYRCKYCHHTDRCHGSEPPAPAVPVSVNCRTCCHSTPIIGESNLAQWRCERKHKTLSVKDQKEGCNEHLFIPAFITFATVEDGNQTDNWIQYVNADGTQWRNWNDAHEGEYSSLELTKLPAPMIGAGYVDELKNTLGATVVEVEQ